MPPRLRQAAMQLHRNDCVLAWPAVPPEGPARLPAASCSSQTPSPPGEGGPAFDHQEATMQLHQMCCKPCGCPKTVGYPSASARHPEPPWSEKHQAMGILLCEAGLYIEGQ